MESYENLAKELRCYYEDQQVRSYLNMWWNEIIEYLGWIENATWFGDKTQVLPTVQIEKVGL